MPNNLFMLIFMQLACLLLASCQESKPIISDLFTAKVISGNIILESKSYNIPKGAFKGAFWPSNSNENFRIWVIDKGKEKIFNISPPKEFSKYEKDVTESWEIKVVVRQNSNTIVYSATNKGKNYSIQVELPLINREYGFAVLKNYSNEEMLIFLNLSEDIIDNGIFGYVVIKNAVAHIKE